MFKSFSAVILPGVEYRVVSCPEPLVGMHGHAVRGLVDHRQRVIWIMRGLAVGEQQGVIDRAVLRAAAELSHRVAAVR